MLTREPLLIIDDDAGQRLLLEAILAELPYALTITGSAAEALTPPAGRAVSPRRPSEPHEIPSRMLPDRIELG